MNHVVITQLQKSKTAQNLITQMQTAGVVSITGCQDIQKSHLIALAAGDTPFHVVIGYREQKVKQLMESVRFYRKDVVYYPAKDLLFYQADVRGDEIIRERSKVYRMLEEAKSLMVFTTMEALLDGLSDRKQLRAEVLTIENGQVLDVEELKQTLVKMGYERVYQVETPGEFSVRGGIVDIYPLSEENAYRLEFFDDEVDSIRMFEPASQRSIENCEQMKVYPLESEEMAKSSEAAVSFLDWFDPEQTKLYVDDLDRCFANIKELYAFVEESRLRREEAKVDLGDAVLFGDEDVKDALKRFPLLAMSPLDDKLKALVPKEEMTIPVSPTNHYHNSFDALKSDLKKNHTHKYKTLLVSASRTRAKRLAQDLLEDGLSAFYTEDLSHEIKDAEVMVTTGRLAEGFAYPNLRLSVITDGDVFTQRRKAKKRAKSSGGEMISSFSDLKVGDYVIHENHGLGIYRGIDKIETQGLIRDFIKIEYAKKGNLYMQISQLDLLQKYTGAQGRKPKLDVLGGKEWQKTKSRVRSAVDEIAQELVDLYAIRSNENGFVYGPDTVWQQEFEEDFPYEETEDQIAAIQSVKKDMESTKIMDRLICGDVGFGKTEIAIRAAFKAVQEEKQVVYLVPTTILAEQHYNTFKERMEDFPVRVDLMCRFRTPAQQKDTIAGLKSGQVDIVIGTHRLLSKDVEYKDLGLLIIDEEQRFGVSHKEKIKQLKHNIDVLSLTATPIPRTLHMSLIGIRDMSLLEEAPQNRQPIQTFVMEYQEEIVREAIVREMKRGGQIFYVYNNVRTIADIARDIEKLVPDARVKYAHGQMRERELEDVMMAFINKEIDVLVSTTIIETGVDISNANTMIIHDSDRLGLSQLYQLRGRVGRSDRSAYAFLMYKRDKMLKEVAEKRLSAIREFTALGSGFRIAMRDLEIRGAGNLLGKSQSGNMEAVGYDLYCKMLNESVARMKGEAIAEQFDTSIDLNVDAYIPDSYIENTQQKMDIYKRIALIASREDREEMEDELIDRFGDLPRPVQLLLQSAQIKAFAHQAYLLNVKEKGDAIELEYYPQAQIDPTRIPTFQQSYRNRLYFHAKPTTGFTFMVDAGKKKMDQLFELSDLLEKMMLELVSES